MSDTSCKLSTLPTLLQVGNAVAGGAGGGHQLKTH